MYEIVFGGAEEALKKKYKGEIISVKTQVQFELNRSGLISVKKAEGKIENQFE